MVEPANSVNQSVVAEDRVSEVKTIYNASYGEIFLKNFLAGFGRAIGGIFIYMVFIGIAFYSFMAYAYPQIKPLFDEYRQAVQGINQLNGVTTKPGAGPGLKQSQQFLKDLQESLPGQK